MRGNQKIQQRLASAGLAYVVLGCALNFYTIGYFFRAETGGIALLSADQALKHSLVIATVLLLLAGACALTGAMFLNRFRRS